MNRNYTENHTKYIIINNGHKVLIERTVYMYFL